MRVKRFWHVQHALAECGIEEHRAAATARFTEVQVEQHPAKVLIHTDGLLGAIGRGEPGGKLTRAKERSAEALTPLNSSAELVAVLGGIGLRTVTRNYIRGNDVGDVP